MSFTGDCKTKIDEATAAKIIADATYLGRSHYEKDCYWSCYVLDGQYYIGLCDSEHLWSVDKSDVDVYLEVKQ